MNLTKKIALALSSVVALAASGSAQAVVSVPNVRITEWMYNSSAASGLGEFVEFTNLGSTAVNFSGWSFDDNSRTPGSQALGAFGFVNPGESVILTDATEADFRASWNLATSVKVIGGNTNNLGRSDEINLYDNSGTLVDQLTYNDQGTGSVKGPRTSGVSAHPGSLAVIGTNNASGWVLSAVGDAEHSYKSLASGALVAGDTGSPGFTSFAAAVPEPESYALMLAGFGLIGAVARRRRH